MSCPFELPVDCIDFVVVLLHITVFICCELGCYKHVKETNKTSDDHERHYMHSYCLSSQASCGEVLEEFKAIQYIYNVSLANQ